MKKLKKVQVTIINHSVIQLCDGVRFVEVERWRQQTTLMRRAFSTLFGLASTTYGTVEVQIDLSPSFGLRTIGAFYVAVLVRAALGDFSCKRDFPSATCMASIGSLSRSIIRKLRETDPGVAVPVAFQLSEMLSSSIKPTFSSEELFGPCAGERN
jgi:hypothetical protein